MVGRGVRVPRAWGRKRERSPIPHRTGCPSPLKRSNRSGAGFRTFKGRPDPDRHVDKLFTWLIFCADANIQTFKGPGVGKNLCEATISRPAVVFAFSAIPRNADRIRCARARIREVCRTMHLRPIAAPRRSWCGGGALQDE